MTQPLQPLDFSSISLRYGDRGIIIGDTRSGKSYLAKALIDDYTGRYRAADAKVLVVDTKPHYSAEWQANGFATSKKYRDLQEKFWPGSVLVERPEQLQKTFQWAQVVIIQSHDESEIGRLTAIMWEFWKIAATTGKKKRKPMRLYIDEGHDFYSVGGAYVSSPDPIAKCARAGGEIGVSVLFLAQRPKGLSIGLVSWINKGYFFATSWEDDLKRLRAMGIPAEIIYRVPQKFHQFIYWTQNDPKRIWGPYQLG